MIESILKKTAQFWNRIFSTKELLPYERLALDAWRATISENNKNILDAQLDVVELIQHQAADAKVCFYYQEGRDMPLFRAKEPDLHVATVLLRSSPDGLETMRAKVILHRGRFFSIEFPKRPKRYLQQHHMHMEALQVAGVETHAQLE